jgi:hypothetical protein
MWSESPISAIVLILVATSAMGLPPEQRSGRADA